MGEGLGEGSEHNVERVAVVYQPGIADAQALADRCAAFVRATGRDVQLYSSWDLGPAVPSGGLTLAITFGGDGSTLRVARWLAANEAPIVGVKMGRLGFLAELLPDELPESLGPYLAGDYWLDVRAMARAELLPPPPESDGPHLPVPPSPPWEQPAAMPSPTALEAMGPLVALNDVVVGRAAAGRAVRATVEMDGTVLAHWTADGVIVATATGSTAYSFAAGGPILMPELPNLVVTPIAPHVHGTNGIVLPPDVVVTIRVSTPQTASVSLDGHIDLPLLDGQGVTVRVAEERTRFARRGRRSDFYRGILEKLR
jgi:NAD+ kinase